jgi:DNA-directed RNA polymerase specialized sigma subunit
MPVYFDNNTEKAIIEYNSTEDNNVKNKIYDERIRYSFNKLVENIIFSFNFRSKFDDYETLKDKTIGDLFLKIKKFDHTRGFKAYSFFGTCAKNFILMELKVENKSVSIVNLEEDQSENSTGNYSTQQILENFCIHDNLNEKNEFNDMVLDFLVKEQKKNKYFIDEKLLDAVEHAFKNQLEITNKKALFLFLREFTGLTTTEISSFLKKFRPKLKNHVKKYFNGEI